MAAQYLKQGGEEAPTVAGNARRRLGPATDDARPCRICRLWLRPLARAPGTTRLPTPNTTATTAGNAGERGAARRLTDGSGAAAGRASWSMKESCAVRSASRRPRATSSSAQIRDVAGEFSLHAPRPTWTLSRYKGMHIIVTGEEGLDARWKNTPVICDPSR